MYQTKTSKKLRSYNLNDTGAMKNKKTDGAKTHASESKIHVHFDGKLVIIGFGSIGQGVLPLIVRHIGIPRKNISIVTGDNRGRAIAEKEGINFHVEPLNPQNYR